MNKFSPLILLITSALLSACGSTGDALPDGSGNGTPAGLMGSFSLQAMREDETLNAHDRVWYQVRVLEMPEELISDYDPRIDAMSPSTVRAITSATSGKQEGLHYLLDGEERLWLSCKDSSNTGYDEEWCGVTFPVLCHSYPCLFEFRIADTPHPEGILDGKDWNANPEGWMTAQLKWEDEFGPADRYQEAYGELELEYHDDAVTSGPTVDLRIEAGTVHARGWLRRLKEEHGITVTPQER